MINIITDEERSKYVFDLIFNTCGLEYGFNLKENCSVSIVYSDRKQVSGERCINIYKSSFWKNYKRKSSLPDSIKKYSYDSTNDIVGFYFDPDYDGEECVRRNNNAYAINVDIIASIFYLVTRYEEYMKPEERDRYGRFSAKSSFLYKDGLHERALVNEYIDILTYLILKVDPSIRTEKSVFKCIYTHDVDFLLLYEHLPAAELIKDLFFRHDINMFKQRIEKYITAKKNYRSDPYWTFDEFIEREKKMESYYYFMANGPYDMHDNRVRELIRRINLCGAKVGLHGSKESHNNKDLMMKEKNALLRALNDNNDHSFIRQHFLMFDAGRTWRVQNDSGFKYDMTCGYHDAAGFRCGTCTPFKTYDLESDKALDLIEVPLVVMDVTLRYYQSLDLKGASEKISNLKNVCMRHGGNFVILWHNSFFYTNEDWMDLYRSTV